MKLSSAIANAVLAAFPVFAAAQDTPPPAASPTPAPAEPTAEAVTVRLKDGSLLRARIIDQDEQRVKVVTLGGLALEIPAAMVERIDRTGSGAEAPARPSDSNYTRLLFSPTGRPLGRGEGYFSDHYVFFPGVAYGITNNISVGGGVTVVPGLGISEQLYYATARAGKQFSERFGFSGGVLYAAGGESEDEADLGVVFGMATFGKPDKSLTLGGGVARTTEYDTLHIANANGMYRFEPISRVSHTPVVLIGGTIRISRRTLLVSENWLILTDHFKLSEQPFALGVRFLGDRLSADVGFVFIGEVIEEGLPVPWLSVTYHFGKSK